MIKKRLEWLKRGLCITLAGAMIICSDTMAFAADTANGQVVEQTGETEVLTGEQSDQTKEDAKNEKASEVTDKTKVTEQAETETTGTTEKDKTTEVTETTENTETTEVTETTENTETTEVTETTENTEATEVTESTEKTEETEKPEGTETTEETETKATDVSKVILITDSEYQVVSIDQSITLPDYVFYPNSDTDKTAVEWTVDDLNVAEVATTTDANGKISGTIKAKAAGVAVVKLQVVGKTEVNAAFRLIVRPTNEPKNCKADATYNSVSLSWSPVADANGYTITRKTEGEEKETVLAHVSGANTVSYLDESVQTGTKYIYHVYAYTQYVDDKGQQQYADTEKFAAVTKTPQLSQAKLTSVAAEGCNSLTLIWDKVEGADGYVVLRSENGKEYTQAADITDAKTTYVDASLTAGMVYSYKVQAYRNINGKKVYGEESGVLSGKPLPSATTLTAQSAGYKAIQLTWNAVDGVNGYAVYRKAAGKSGFDQIATVNADTTSYKDTKVTSGVSYTYKVKAYKNVNGTQVWGDDSNEATAVPALQAPQVTLTNTTYNSVTVSWNKVSGAQGYNIYRSTKPNSGFKVVKKVNNKSTVKFVDKKLSVGKTYYYQVCAFRAVGGKNAEGERSAVLSVNAAPEGVKVKAVAAGATAVKLTWKTVTMPSTGGGYDIYQVTDGVDKKIKSCSKKKTSYTVKNLTPGQSYTFKIVTYAKNKKGKAVSGGTSNILTTSPQLLPVAIDKVVSSDYNSVLVSWKTTVAADEDGYLVYRATSKKGKYKKVGTVAKNNGEGNYSYNDTGVKLGKKYYYKVVATRNLADGNVMRSAYSAPMSVTAAPGITTVAIESAGNGSLKLNWKKVKTSEHGYVKGYAIYRSTTEKGKYKKIKTINKGTTDSYVDKGLTTGNTYYYKVRTFCKSGGKTIYSADSEIVSMQVKPDVASIQVVAANYNTITVSWKKIDGCSGYTVYRSAQADGKYKAVKTLSSANKLSYKDTGLSTGQTYYYKVRAYVKKGGKKIYGEYSGVKNATPVLGKPTGLYATSVDNNQIKLTWDAVAGAETYTVLRSTSEHGKYKIATEICSTNSYVDVNVAVGKTYYYKVYAVRGEFVSETTDCVSVVSASIELSTTSVVIKTGTSVKITATVKPAGVIAWTSSDSKIAVVSSDGTIYGIKAGSTTVKATVNGITKSISVTVKDKLETENKTIDISSDNGTIDFNAVKAAGYECVMLRISRGTTEDANFKTNYKNAKAAGLKVGGYCYALAQNAAQAKSEGDKVLSIVGGQKLDYPIVYMMEDESLLYNNLNKTQRNELVYAFRKEIIEAGKQYSFALGISQTMLEKYPDKYLDTSQFTGMDLWITNYRAENLGSGYQGKGNVIMWRYTQQGTVSGVNGKVNISIRYKNY